MKPGGQEIYVGPLGRHSFHLIKYFEVRISSFNNTLKVLFLFYLYYNLRYNCIFILKEIKGVAKIKDQYNPATWMLEVTSPAQELALGVDFTDLYKNSELYR